MDHLTIKLFGSFQVHHGGKPLTDFATVKTRALLAYLALEANTAHGRDKLADLLWPDSPADLARQSLRQTLSYLKRALRGFEDLTIDRNSVELALTEADVVDVTAFAGLIDACRRHRHRDLLGCQSCIARLQSAAELVVGAFLADVYVKDSAPFEEWATLKREWTRRLATRTFGQLCEAYERRGNAAKALALAWRLCEMAPWDETAHRTLLRLLAADGQRNVALAHHREFSATLADELGVAPTEETQALVAQIRQGHVPPLIRPRHNLPAAATPFVGRRAELQAIGDHLASPDCRLLTLTGPGGIGKTRLALRAAEAQLGAYRDGLFWVSLNTCQSPEDVATAIGAAMAYAFDVRGEPEAQVRDYLRNKALLLILDNFEHVLEARSLISALLRYAPGTVLLATSRERLNLREEWVLELDGLPVAPADGSRDQDGDDAVRLFWTCAARAGYTSPAGYTNRAGHVPDALATGPSPDAVSDRMAAEEDAAAAIRICQLVDGVPLGIELAAASLPGAGVAAVAAQIAGSLDALSSRFHDMPARHRSLRASFDHSWALLGVAEQDAFSALSVFTGTFTTALAQAIAGATPEILQQLADKSLVQRGTDGHLSIHPVLRQYAAERLAQAPERASQLRDRHAGSYLALLADHAWELGRAARPEALAALQQRIGNIRAAWEWAVQRRHWPSLAQAADGLADYYLLRGPVQEGLPSSLRRSRRSQSGTVTVGRRRWDTP
ncbi:MAG: hypothetical protein JXC32_06020 [Anaerolineae bacterium]|nr:hypothetical protein [Anaerolineae bacterium]